VPQPKRRGEILRFKNDPACRVFLSTDTGGQGLNLQQASVVVNCDLPWSPARLEQRVARAWRKNQVRNVTVVNLVSEDSIESRMVATLAHKQALADGVLDGEDGLDRLEIGVGRQAFLKRVSAVVGAPAETPAAARPSREALRALDPELGFAADVSDRLGGRLVACEARRTVDGKPAVLLAVDGGAAEALSCAERAATEWFGRGGGEPAVEVVDAAAYEAIRRVVAHGLLAEPGGATRVLFARNRGLARPLLAGDETRVKAAELRARAAKAFQRARQCVARLAFDAAHAPLEEAVVCLARTYAVQRGLPEPQDVRQAVSAAFEGLWGDTRPIVTQLLESDGSPVSVTRALSTRFV
jgi:hypothetical protein